MEAPLQHRSRLIKLMMASLFIITGLTARAQARSPLDSITVTIRVTNKKMLAVIKSIQAQTGYLIFYNTKSLDDQKRVTCSFERAKLNVVLKALFPDFTWKFDGRGIVLLRNPTPENQVSNTLSKPSSGILEEDTIIHDLNGTVVDEKGGPLPGATVLVKGTTRGAVTNAEGKFSLGAISRSSVLAVSSLGFEPAEVKVRSDNSLKIKLQSSINNIEGVNIVSTGYQSIGRERATGSYDLISNQTINRSVSTDIVSRLEGVASGVLFDGNNGNELGISIRGRSTIYANTSPLVVLDNFPYDGDIKNINPNDIQSITILKDAAAASIWGVQAANGVIVITTKRGNYNNRTALSINTNTTIGAKPNLYYSPILSSSDYIDIEKYLFNNGYYDGTISSPFATNAFTPAIYALIKNRNGETSNTELAQQLADYGKIDVRNDMNKYLYETSVNQQYNINLSGGTISEKYFVSGGYDKNISNLNGDKYERLTFNGSNTYLLARDKLELTTNLIFTQTKTVNDGISSSALTYGSYSLIYPYAKLADKNGNPLAIDKYYEPLMDTIGGGKLLDWSYKPLDEQKLANNQMRGTDYKLNIGLAYKISNCFNLDFKYQYSKGQTISENIHSLNSFYTRDLINTFSSINYDNGTVQQNIPLGGIYDIYNSNYTGQHARLQGAFNKDWFKQSIVAIAGMEMNDLTTQTNGSRLYGYDPNHGSSIPVDYKSLFTSIITGGQSTIQPGPDVDVLSNRTISFFGNAAYTYLGRFTFSISGRKDGANIFGVRANQKIVPFWSSGFSWNVSKAPPYHLTWLPDLKVRTTFGYNGNVDRSISALLVTQIGGVNYYGQNFAAITNPPNPDLRWEKSAIFNIGIDYTLLSNQRVYGSIDYYLRKGIGLIGDQLLPPSSGFTTLRGNSANMKGLGLDLIINAKIIDSKFKWITSLQYNISKNKVTEYKIPPGPISQYITQAISPLVGKSVTSMYSYGWRGLDPQTGDPLGVSEGKVTKDYSSILYSTDLKELVYNGPQQPPVFGNFMNTFSYKNLSLSINMIYKFGGYFRRPSINYSSVFSGNSLGNNDYERRWKEPGDEKNTNIPSMNYPSDLNRDIFYTYSSQLVQKSDFIRVKDVTFTYDINSASTHILPLSNIRIYAYVNNVGLLWKKNKNNIDPDFVPSSGFSYTAPVSFSFGVKIGL